MNKYELIERLKLYYLMPSYWQKRRRKCWYCGFSYNRNLGYANFGKAFDTAKPKRYWHEFCYALTQGATPNYPARGGQEQ